MVSNQDDNTITYILRCHSVTCLPKLKTALLSVSGQRYPSLKALVAVQNLPTDEVGEITAAIDILRDVTGLDVDVTNFIFPEGGDYRGALLNRALETVRSRYVSFLDYDDVVYPNHAEILIRDLRADDHACLAASFGGCVQAFYDDLSNGAIYITSKAPFVRLPTVLSCIIENCFPIHSYVVDLTRLHYVPQFGESSPFLEDYVFLLDLLEHHCVSVVSAQTPVCEYRLNNDGSNTFSRGGRKSHNKHIGSADLRRVWAGIEQKKRTRCFRVPYDEILSHKTYETLSHQPLIRGVLVCYLAKRIRKRQGVAEAAKFLSDPKRYCRGLPTQRRSLLMRVFF
jgi:hypothetical protein